MPRCVTILTYNIRSGRGIDGRRSISRIAAVARSTGADIVCLQEVEQRISARGWNDQPRRLAHLLGMHAEFHAALALKLYNFGNVILTRYPIVRVARHALASKGEQRGVLEMRLESDLGPLSVFCTHWGLNAEERLTQADETAAIVNASCTPRIVCGDLNETPERAAVRALMRRAGLSDLAAQAGSPGPTFPSDNPRVRIDYILASTELAASAVGVVDSAASDHRPLRATVMLATPGVGGVSDPDGP